MMIGLPADAAATATRVASDASLALTARLMMNAKVEQIRAAAHARGWDMSQVERLISIYCEACGELAMAAVRETGKGEV